MVDVSSVALRGGLLALGLCLAGCEPEPVPDGPPVRLEVGTGLDFTAIEAGSTIQLTRGCQGSQHVYVSLRAWDMTVYRNSVELSLERASDGEEVSANYEVKLRFDPPASEGEPALLEGLLLVVPDADDAVDREVRLLAFIKSEEGHRAADTRTATLRWGPPACP